MWYEILDWDKLVNFIISQTQTSPSIIRSIISSLKGSENETINLDIFSFFTLLLSFNNFKVIKFS